MWFITLILLILILGIIILVHEFGHFITAKKSGVHIYEFSIGMGPLLKTFKGKDGIDYNLRVFPIGGFVSMAGEVYEDADTQKIPKEKFMCNKKWWQRVLILAAGVINNFILAILVLFIISLIWGAKSLDATVSAIPNSPVSVAGVVEGDRIVSVNGHKVSTWDQARIYMSMEDKDETYSFGIKHKDGKVDTYDIKKGKYKLEDGTEQEGFGFSLIQTESRGLFASIKYAFAQFGNLLSTMWITVINLFTGKIALKSLSGPVGIYHIVGQSLGLGINEVLYLLAYLSINVGLINILPIPAFDGGRILFLIIEKIKGSPINAKFENMCHTIFFFLLIALMIYITIVDLFRFA